MGISQSLPVTGYIKMIDIWMIFTMSYPFVVITLHCLEKIAVDRGTRRVNVKGKGDLFIDLKPPTNFFVFFFEKMMFPAGWKGS